MKKKLVHIISKHKNIIKGYTDCYNKRLALNCEKKNACFQQCLILLVT